jgi:hypothetical protein
LAARAAQVKRGSAPDRLDLAHVGQEVAQEVLDAVLEGRGRGRAARAGALHVEVDDAVLEAAEGDVAAVAGDRRADAGLEQLLDGLDRRRVGSVEELLAVGSAGGAGTPDQDRGAGHEMLHDGGEDRRLHVLPLALALGHGDEVVAEEDAGDAGDLEQALGKGRRRRARRVAGIEGAFRHHHLAGQELQGRRIRRGFGLDEHLWVPHPVPVHPGSSTRLAHRPTDVDGRGRILNPRARRSPRR